MSTPTSLDLQVADVVKAFGPTRALRGVSLDVRGGEIHGLIGHNGSGKSTLVKILAGVETPDEGAVSLGGTALGPALSARERHALGLAFVHQDLGVLPQLPVLDNFRVGRYGRRWRGGPVHWRRERRATEEALAEFGLSCDARAPLSELREAERALLAIARAVDQIRAAPSGVLVLDEPTVFLDRHSAARLFGAMRVARSLGRGVLFISHKLEEVCASCDRVTVLREGEVVATLETGETSPDALIELMLGRRPAPVRPARSQAVLRAAPALEVRDLAGGGVARASFVVHQGEILGLTGLIGAGFEDVPYLLYGSAPATAGTLRLAGEERELVRHRPRRALRDGIVLVPSDRASGGMAGSLSVRENLTLPRLRDFFRGLRLRGDRERAAADELIAGHGIAPAAREARISSLSGGNQQKVVLAKWFQGAPRVALLHEPTQGVDLGARATIFALLSAAAKAGCAVVVASSDEDALAEICDRVIVFHDGVPTTELAGEALRPDVIAGVAYQSPDDVVCAATAHAQRAPRIPGHTQAVLP